jgi:hypothetical protein
MLKVALEPFDPGVSIPVRHPNVFDLDCAAEECAALCGLPTDASISARRVDKGASPCGKAVETAATWILDPCTASTAVATNGW